MIRFIIYIVTTLIWQLVFNHINRLDFISLVNNFRVHLLSINFRNLLNLFWDLISNRVLNNNIFRALPAIPNVNLNTLLDTSLKRIFWLSFVSILLLYRQINLFKRLILWPFKLGVFSFIFSTLGIDVTWLLSLFNLFPLNIPQWVYIQYLTLYANWLNWWKKTVYIKNLTVDKPIPKDFKFDKSELTEVKDSDTNKILNKRNLYILLGVLTIAGIGFWYYFYYTGGGGAGNNNVNIPPAGGIPPVIPTDNVGGLTEAQRIQALVDIQRLRNSGLISMADYDNMRYRFLPPLPAYEDPIEAPLETVAEASSSNTQPRPSTTRVSPTSSNPVVEQEINRYFPHPEGSTPVSLGRPDSPDSPLLSSNPSSSSGTQRSNTPLILPEASSSSDNSSVAELASSVSPTGSNDSSDTITYIDGKGKQKVMITRKD